MYPLQFSKVNQRKDCGRPNETVTDRAGECSDLSKNEANNCVFDSNFRANPRLVIEFRIEAINMFEPNSYGLQPLSKLSNLVLSVKPGM